MKNKKKGFTLVELVIVIAVIAILAAVLIPTFSSVIKNANNSADLQLVNNLNIIASTHTVSDTDNEFELADNIHKMLKEEGINPDSLTTKNKNVVIVYNTATKKFERQTLNDDKSDLVAFADDAEESAFYVGYYLEEIFENRILVSTRGNDLAEAIFALHNLPSDVDAGYIDKQLKKIPSELQEKVQFIMEDTVFITESGTPVSISFESGATVVDTKITEGKTRIIFHEHEQDFYLSTVANTRNSLVAIIPNYVQNVYDDDTEGEGDIIFAGNTDALNEEMRDDAVSTEDARQNVNTVDKKKQSILQIANGMVLEVTGVGGRKDWATFQDTLQDDLLTYIKGNGETVSSANVSSMNDGTYYYGATEDGYVNGGTYQFTATVDGTSVTGLVKYQTVQIGTSFNNSSTTWYTIEDALAKAASATKTSEKTVIVQGSSTNYTQGTSDAIVTVFTALDDSVTGYSDACRTIGIGVTLLLPYDGLKNSNTNTNGTESHVIGNSDYKKLELIIPDNMTLVNNGTITINGSTTGGTAQSSYGAGHTAGRYAQITLGAGATIESIGTINAYGFIMEEADTNGSAVNMLSGGTITMPFFIQEHRGGSAFLAMAKENMSGGIFGIGGTGYPQGAPFNRYYMQNVTSTLNIVYGASVVGKAYMYATTALKSDIYFIGNSNSCFFQLTEGSSATWKYNLDWTKVNTDGNKYVGDPTEIEFDIHGSVNINSISVTISTNTMSTSKAALPIPWYYNVTFHKFENGDEATIDSTGQDIKVLPGATVTVEQGVTLRVTQLIVLDTEFDDPRYGYNSSGNPVYPTDKDGQLIINGTLEAGSLGGKVSTAMDGAILRATANTAVAYELTTVSGSSFTAAVGGWTPNERTLMNTDGSELSAGNYKSENGKWVAA